METLISALLYMGLTAGAYFYDYKGASRKNKVFSSIIFLAMLCALVSWQSLLFVKRREEEQSLQILTKTLQEQLKQQETKNEELQAIIEAKPLETTKDKAEDLPLSPKRDNLLDNLIVQYFNRDIDPEKLPINLKDLKNNAQLQELSILNCEPQSCSYQTNAIWYGANVEIEQVKAIAKLLISSGINIKVIQPFFEPEQKPSNLVQIGAENRALNCNTWQKEEILAIDSFPENRLGCP